MKQNEKMVHHMNTIKSIHNEIMLNGVHHYMKRLVSRAKVVFNYFTHCSTFIETFDNKCSAIAYGLIVLIKLKM